MSLSDYEKQQIVDELDILEEGARRLILASLEAFTEWLANVMYAIYIKLKSAIKKLWKWLVAQFE